MERSSRLSAGSAVPHSEPRAAAICEIEAAHLLVVARCSPARSHGTSKAPCLRRLAWATGGAPRPSLAKPGSACQTGRACQASERGTRARQPPREAVDRARRAVRRVSIGRDTPQELGAASWAAQASGADA